jgi:hypothetical protein
MKAEPSLECRICLETDHLQNLVAPCSCKGSGKYVHNKCLLEWYKHQPDKALTCSVCKTQLSRRESKPQENYELVKSTIEEFKLHNPLAIIGVSHCLYFSGVAVLGRFPYVQPTVVYLSFQGFLHCIFLLRLLNLLFAVKNQEEYWLRMRRRTHMWMVLCVHILNLLFLGKTLWFGGVSCTLMLHFYVYEHADLLIELNATSTLVFTNRRGRPPKPLPLSSS